MAHTIAFNLNRAVDDALARLHFHIRESADAHQAQLDSRGFAMRTAWRNRHLLMLRELRGIAFPPQHVDPRCAIPFQYIHPSDRT